MKIFPVRGRSRPRDMDDIFRSVLYRALFLLVRRVFELIQSCTQNTLDKNGMSLPEGMARSPTDKRELKR